MITASVMKELRKSTTQLTFTYSKSAVETVGLNDVTDVKYVQN